MASFPLFWALSLIVHVWQYYLLLPSPLTFVLLGMACLVFLFPRNTSLMAIAAAVQLAQLCQVLPNVANSWLFTGFCSLTILWGYFVCLWREKKISPAYATMMLQILLPLRLQTITLYAIAAFHKLNQDYFNPNLSCAVTLYQSYAQLVPLLPAVGKVQYVVIYASLITEFLIAFLFLQPRWRFFGVMLAFVFHYFLSLIPLVSLHSFSFLMYAMAILFLENDSAGVSKEKIKGNSFGNNINIATLSYFSLRLLLVIILATFAMQWSGVKHIEQLRSALNVFAQIVGFLLCVYMLVQGRVLFSIPPANEFTRIGKASLCSFSAKAGGICLPCGAVPADIFNVRWYNIVVSKPQFRWSHLIFPALVLFNGLQPYLGLSTDHSFSMYSNLRTEKLPNHFLMRVLPQIFDFQKAVQITKSSDPQLDFYVQNKSLIPFFNLQKYLFVHPHVEVSYIVDGSPLVLQTGEEERKTYSPILGKFLLMKPSVLLGNENSCRH